MSEIFMNILNMSLTAGYCIAAVVLIRFLLRRQPKIFSYLLWSIVLFRLLCPVSLSSPYSLLRMDTALVSQESITGRLAADGAVWQGKTYPYADGLQETGKNTQDRENGADMLMTTEARIRAARIQTVFTAGAWIWLAGMVLLAVYGTVTTFRLGLFLKNAVPAAGGFYEAEGISTPFVFGIVRPRIYLPAGLSEQERRFVLEHERVHIARKDYLVKIIAWAAVCIHWFNPLVWLAFMLMENDMEMSCDEAVLRKSGADVRQEYSRALLSLACEKTRIGGCPLAFGEGKVKGRVLNVLTYRKKTFAAVLAAVVIVVIAVSGFSLNPVRGADKKEDEEIPAFVTEYANAFVGRDGNGLVGLYIDEETAFENVIMLDGAGGEYTFGYSSPWPDEYRLAYDAGEQKAYIKYYAFTSDPHVTVWKEEVSFAQTGEGYRVTGSSMKVFDSISSAEEFEEAYKVFEEYQFADYAERGYVEAVNDQTEYDREAGDGTDRNAVYRNPDTAAEYILNLAGGKSVTSSDSNGTAVVTYTFEDGSAVTIPMYNANYTSETGSTADAYPENTGDGDVWIVDLNVWNA